MTRFHHILVPVDFEAPAQVALDSAIDLALTFDARLTLIHAWEVSPYVYSTLPYVSADLWTAVEQGAKEQLRTTLALAARRAPRAESILAQGPPAQAILTACEQVKADLIVMGTHGRRGVSRVLLGSVAEKVVRLATVPVLTIRGTGSPS